MITSTVQIGWTLLPIDVVPHPGETFLSVKPADCWSSRSLGRKIAWWATREAIFLPSGNSTVSLRALFIYVRRWRLFKQCWLVFLDRWSFQNSRKVRLFLSYNGITSFYCNLCFVFLCFVFFLSCNVGTCTICSRLASPRLIQCLSSLSSCAMPSNIFFKENSVATLNTVRKQGLICIHAFSQLIHFQQIRLQDVLK